MRRILLLVVLTLFVAAFTSNLGRVSMTRAEFGDLQGCLDHASVSCRVAGAVAGAAATSMGLDAVAAQNAAYYSCMQSAYDSCIQIFP